MIDQKNFELLNHIRKNLKNDSNFRGKNNKVEQVYNQLAKTLFHEKSILEIQRRYPRLGKLFQIEDYSTPTPTKKTDAILLNDERSTIGKYRLGNQNWKIQLKWRTPTTFASIGIKNQDLETFKKENIILIISVPKALNTHYYQGKTRYVNTDEHDFYIWIPNKPKLEKAITVEINNFTYLDLETLNKTINLNEIEQNQSKLSDFIKKRGEKNG